MCAIEIDPIIKRIEVGRSAPDAFRIFAKEITSWWPLSTHTRAKDALGQKSVRVTIEPKVGGRIYETLEDGEELDWGRVLIYEPGVQLRLEWQLGHPPEQATEVSVAFEPMDDASCRVTLTHDHWERFGDEAQTRRQPYSDGWKTVFEERFGNFAAGSSAAADGQPAALLGAT